MKQHKDHAIVLARVNYGERDRILTLICEKLGKTSVLAKGVRAEKSRLAGGIELLCESEIGLTEGRSNIKILTSARLSIHFNNLVKDMSRMNQAYSYIKAINGITEDAIGQEYYPVLLIAFTVLNDPDYDPGIIDIWFNLRMLRLFGSAPDLTIEGGSTDDMYEFDYDRQKFVPGENGGYTGNDLKILRLCIARVKPPRLQNELDPSDKLQTLTRTLLQTNVTEV